MVTATYLRGNNESISPTCSLFTYETEDKYTERSMQGNAYVYRLIRGLA